MLYYTDISYYYIELIHILSSDYLWISIQDNKIIDKKVRELIEILKETLKEEK